MCQCKLCVRHKSFESQLAKIPGAQAKQLRDYFRIMYDSLTEAEMDREYYRAVVDGSWPTADQVITHIRNARAAKQQKGDNNEQV